MKAILGILLLISAPAFAATSPATQALLKWAKVETYPRGFSAFHYVVSDRLNNGAQPASHLQSAVQEFWNLNQKEVQDDAAGMYLAGDPFVTANFGDVMFMVKIPAGSRTLDLRHQAQLPQEILRLLKKEGCATDDVASENGADQYTLRRIFTETTHRGCRAVSLAVLKALNVDLISYDYGISVLPDECEQSMEYAFILLKTDSIDIKKVEMFRSAIPTPDPFLADRIGITSLARRYQSTAMNKIAVDTWPKLSVPRSYDSIGWARGNLLACQPH